MRMGPTITMLALLGQLALLPSAGARNGHHDGIGGRHGTGRAAHGGAKAGGEQRANDDYVKAAAREEDKLLDSKIKSICRGC